MDIKITDLLILAKKERAPAHFTVLKNTTDGKKADFREGRLGHNKRYLSFTKKSPAPTRGRVVLTELKVISSSDNTPFGYAALTYTHDDNTKAFSSKQLLAKFTPLEEVTQAVTDLVVLSASRKEDVPAGYRRLPEINGFSICFKVTLLPKKGPHPSTTATHAVTHAPPSPPPWWTVCPNCAPNAARNYHLIDISPVSEDWSRVTAPLTRVGYTVTKLQRIQNQLLWNRLQSEKQLMSQNHPPGRDLNEMLLYHTTTASKGVICEEGLDQRLSGKNFKNNFGNGIYFSDDPRKCDSYWKKGNPREMFACHVLLGDIKEYPRGTREMSLKREPSREEPEPGLSKTYDSVKGNISGQNEYVVYNMYRMYPGYVLEYMCPPTTSVQLPKKGTHPSPPTTSVQQLRPQQQLQQPDSPINRPHSALKRVRSAAAIAGVTFKLKDETDTQQYLVQFALGQLKLLSLEDVESEFDYDWSEWKEIAHRT